MRDINPKYLLNYLSHVCVYVHMRPHTEASGVISVARIIHLLGRFDFHFLAICILLKAYFLSISPDLPLFCIYMRELLFHDILNVAQNHIYRKSLPLLLKKR